MLGGMTLEVQSRFLVVDGGDLDAGGVLAKHKVGRTRATRFHG
jgi:hypothetical protein